MRERIKHTLPVLLIMLLILAFTGTAAAEPATDQASTEKQETVKLLFTDVAENDSNILFINYLADRKMITGFPDGTYQPLEGLSRAQAAVIIVKAAGLQTGEENDTGFGDVTAEYWAVPYIAAASKAGYIKGFPDGTYQPEAKLTRAQGISLIMRLCTQQDTVALPQLKDMNQEHWVAEPIAVALAAGMITTDGNQINPDQELKRGSLARALGILLTKDPGLNQKTLAGTIKQVKGEIKLTRSEKTTIIENDSQVYAGDIIKAGKDSSANILYPDGSSVLIQADSEFIIKESLGRTYIKKDGRSGTAVEMVTYELKQGTLFGALASKQETMQNKQTAASDYTLLASLGETRYMAQENPPWFKTAEQKKVKMKVDMPYGVAAIRGTFIKVTVNMDGSINLSCLTGDIQFSSKNESGQITNTTNITGGTSGAVTGQGTLEQVQDMTEQDRKGFEQVQNWVVETALQMDVNREVQVEMIVEIPDQAAPAETVKKTLEVIVNALINSGIQLQPEVINSIKEQLEQMQQDIPENLKQEQRPTPTPDPNPGSGTSESPSVSYINYAAPGTYGPESADNKQTIAKNVIVSSPDVILRNMIITRDLTLAAGIGDGDVTLQYVEVQGKTIILGGGEDSIELIDCTLGTVTIDKENNSIRIAAVGNTSIGAVTLQSGAILAENNLSGQGFSILNISPTILAGTSIVLTGNFDAVNIDVPNIPIQVQSGTIGQINISQAAAVTNLNLADGVVVTSLLINAPDVQITGMGNMENTGINAGGTVIQQVPMNWWIAEGISAVIGGKLLTGSGSGNNAKLSSLILSNSTLTPGFVPTIFSYSASVANSVYQVSLSLIPQELTATVQVNGISEPDNSHLLNLDVGDNTFNIEVTAHNGTSLSYNLIVTRAGSSACEITGLSSPTGAAISGNSITASVANEVTSLTVDVTVSPNATWKLYSDSECTNEIVNKQLSLDVGENYSYIKVTAQDGTSLIYNLIVTRAGSSACEIMGVNSPAGAAISGNSITASTANEVTSLTADVTVSPYATWKLYSDNACTNEIVNKQLSLEVGENYSYIKVLAQDGISEGIYSLSICRLSNDATVTAIGTHYLVEHTSGIIQADQTVINTNVTVESFLANLSKHAQASWKVVTEGTTINNQSQFDAATAKSSTATLLFGDKLAVKAEDGTIKIYEITVTLGDPVAGAGSYPGTPSGMKSPVGGFTWGLYKYWLYDEGSNQYWFFVVAFDQNNVEKQRWQISGGRYNLGVSIDTNNQNFVFTFSQGSSPIIKPWTDLMITQP